MSCSQVFPRTGTGDRSGADSHPRPAIAISLSRLEMPDVEVERTGGCRQGMHEPTSLFPGSSFWSRLREHIEILPVDDLPLPSGSDLLQ